MPWPSPPTEPGWERFDPRVVAAVERLPASWQTELLPFAERFVAEEGVRLAFYAAGAALVLIALFVLLRQRGDVTVTIAYPDELRGLFRVRVRNGRGALPDPATEDQIRKGGASTRKEHHMVSRETHFQRLFTGRYHLVVDGLLVDPETDEVLGRIREEKILRVRHRRTIRMDFDAHPSTCPIDLEVVWGDRPAGEAKVTVPGHIDKPRSASDGEIRLFLPKGDYRLLVGCGDRVFDRPLAVDSFRPSTLSLDVVEEVAVFKGCPPAVEPYLRSDLSTVARALERDGQAELGFRLLASQHQADGHTARAADFYESAGDLVAAARLRLEQGELGRAAALFEQAEEWHAAADAHRQGGHQGEGGDAAQRQEDVAATATGVAGRRRDGRCGLLEAPEAGPVEAADGDERPARAGHRWGARSTDEGR